MAITAILGALAGIGSAIGGAAGAVGGGLAAGAGAVGGALGSAAGAIGSGLGAAGSAIGSGLGAVGSGLGQAAGMVGQGLGTFGANIGQGLGVAGQGIAQGAGQAFGPMANAIQGLGAGGGGALGKYGGLMSMMGNMGGGGGGQPGGSGMMNFSGAPQGSGGGFKGQLSGTTPIWQTPGFNPNAVMGGMRSPTQPGPAGVWGSSPDMVMRGGQGGWNPLGALDSIFGGGGATPQRVSAPAARAPDPNVYRGWGGVQGGGVNPSIPEGAGPPPTFSQRAQGWVDQHLDPEMQRMILQNIDLSNQRRHEAQLTRRLGATPNISSQLGSGIMDMFPHLINRQRPQFQPFGRY